MSTHIRIFQTLLLVRQATDDYLTLPTNSTEDEKKRMIVYVGAMCKLLLLDMEKDAGIHWSKKMERAAGLNLLEIVNGGEKPGVDWKVDLRSDWRADRKQPELALSDVAEVKEGEGEADKKESA